jgi:hypothetical protein
VGGTLGALLTGVFATATINSAIPTLTVTGLTGGLAYGQPALMGKQLIAIIATYAFCGIGTLIVLRVVDAITKVRADHDEEILGMDLSQHSERAYTFGGGETVAVVTAEPKPASTPPILGGRFTVAIEGVDEDAMMEHWRGLCQDTGTPISPEFRSIYSRVTTIRGTRFRFRGGDREQIRKNLERLFKEVSPTASARVEDWLAGEHRVDERRHDLVGASR